MTTVPLARGARLLGIHPKTLHYWLAAAQLPLAPHPTDGRIKCVALEDLQEVARRHGRPRPHLAEAPGSQEEQAGSVQAHEAELDPSPASVYSTSSSEADVIQKLLSLESKISTLQEQLAQLALALLQEREQRISTLESFLRSEREGLAMPQQQDTQGTLPGARFSRERPLHPADQRARSRVTALVEYSSQGHYVLVSPQEGELEVAPDSPQWFDWLASQTAFRFIGKSGRFSAYREYRERGQTRCWTACRYFHHRTHKHYMGVTDHLTIDCLEQAAALLQAQILSR